jgi:hypothetical protein
MDNKSTTVIDDAVRLVLAVARLGEADLSGWWRCHGANSTGRYVLSRAFPRTYRSAGLELDVLSAARRHDDALSRRTALHLFSDHLPYRRWAAAWLAEQKTVPATAPLLDDLAGWDPAIARVRLEEWAGSPAGGEETGDGIRLGQLSALELEDDRTLMATARLLASAYLGIGATFRAPYLDLAA